jgi:PilZ domain
MFHNGSRMATGVVMSRAFGYRNTTHIYSGAEKRRSKRHACNLTAGWRLLGAADMRFLPATVVDISRNGFALKARGDCKKGAILSVRLEGVPEKLMGPWLAQVVNGRQAEPGTWIIGCSFCSEFAEADLEAILQACGLAEPPRTSSTPPLSSTSIKPLTQPPASSTSIKPLSAPPPSSTAIKPITQPPPSSTSIKSLTGAPASSTSIRPLPVQGPPPGQSERRTSPRFDAKRVGIIVALANGKRYFGRVTNISANGLGLAMPRSLTVGSVVKVRATNAAIGVPWATVQIRHCRRVNHESLIGCQFTDEASASILESLCPPS